jgi:hypothetical protein
MTKSNFSKANQFLVTTLALFMFLLPVAGCGTPAQTVQQAITIFESGKSYVQAAQSLLPELQQVNPELAKEVNEYSKLAGVSLDNLIAVGNAYLAKPSGDNYQAILNGVDALAATIDARVLAAARITNPQSRDKIMAILAIAATSAHVVVGLLQQRATQKQLKAMPVIAGRVSFKEIRPYLDRREAERELIALGASMTYSDYVLAQAGF